MCDQGQAFVFGFDAAYFSQARISIRGVGHFVVEIWFFLLLLFLGMLSLFVYVLAPLLSPTGFRVIVISTKLKILAYSPDTFHFEYLRVPVALDLLDFPFELIDPTVGNFNSVIILNEIVVVHDANGSS